MSAENEKRITYEEYKKILSEAYSPGKRGRLTAALLELDLSTVESSKRGVYELWKRREIAKRELGF